MFLRSPGVETTPKHVQKLNLLDGIGDISTTTPKNTKKICKKTDKNKYSAFGGLDSLLSISEMPTGSPVVAVGVNKASNAGIYALKILGNSYPEIKTKLKKHKFDQYTSVLKESEELKKLGLTKFVKKKFR